MINVFAMGMLTNMAVYHLSKAEWWYLLADLAFIALCWGMWRTDPRRRALAKLDADADLRDSDRRGR